MTELSAPSGQRPKLLVLASTYPRWSGDTEPGFVHDLCKRLLPWFEVTVVCPHAPDALEHETLEGVRILRYRYAPQHWERLVNDGGIVTNLKRHPWMLALVPTFILMQAWRAFQVMRRERVDVLHAHWLVPQGLIAALLTRVASGSRIPFVVTSHGADLYALKGRLIEQVKHWVAQRASAVTVVSSAMRETLLAKGIADDHVHVIPMGADLFQRFVPAHGSSPRPREMLFVGRLVEKKGLRHLIAVLPLIRQSEPETTLTIAGFGPDEIALKSQVRDLGLSDVVTFLGPVPQAKLPTLYQRAAVFVAPFVTAKSGDQEGLPVALMEAIGCGCPVVAGRVAGIEDLLGQHVGDVCVDPSDHALLASRIVHVLREPELERSRTLQIRTRLLEHLDWSKVSQRYAHLLQSIAAQRVERNG